MVKFLNFRKLSHSNPPTGGLKLFIFLLFVFHLLSSPVLAQGDNPAGFNQLETIFKWILGGITRLGLIAVFVMLLYGGFKYLTAGGNPEKNKAASGVITYAILGLVLMIGAWFILRFIEVFTGVTLTVFSLKIP
jgi:hypothetical protein